MAKKTPPEPNDEPAPSGPELPEMADALVAEPVIAAPDPDAPIEPLPHAAGPQSTKVRVFERITCREVEILKTDFSPELYARTAADAKKPFAMETAIR